MYLQSRTRRWLQTLNYALPLLNQSVEMMELYAAHANVPGARQISERDKQVSVLLPLDPIQMTLESQPIVQGSWLAGALSQVTAALDNIDYGDGFVSSIAALVAAVEDAIPVLEERTIEPDESLDEIIADLERSLLVSIVVPLTDHNRILPLVDDWTSDHHRFLQGSPSAPTDVGHYFEVKTFSLVDEPGPGRIHMQHLVSACDAGMTSFVAGATQQSVEHYPEILAVGYAQWFAYAFAIWDEQFRRRLAKYWDAQTDEKIRYSDILINYFGDIRLIRNDVVHNKGICKVSAGTAVLHWGLVEGKPIEISAEQMIELISLFPYDDLRQAPIPQASKGSVRPPGKIDAHLLEDINDRARELGLSDDELSAAAYAVWLETAAPQA